MFILLHRFHFWIIPLFLSILLLGCSSPSSADTASGNAVAPRGTAGTYRMTELYNDKGESMNEKLQELAGQDQYIVLELQEDGTGQYHMFEETTDVTWTDASLTMNGETHTMTLDGDTLVITAGEESSGKMVFVRAEDSR